MKNIIIEQVSIKELMEKIEEIVNNSIGSLKIQKNKNEELLTRNQTAKLLQVSLVTLHHWEKKGVLIPNKIGTRVYYWQKDILKALKQRESDKKLS